jgi:serine/threonine protein kinase
MVLELCKYGSLSDVIRGTDSQPPLALHISDKLYLALGCAKGVYAIHSYNKNLCHRDIKSFNFLVDKNLTVKIADLEFGVDDNNYGHMQDFALRYYDEYTKCIKAFCFPCCKLNPESTESRDYMPNSQEARTGEEVQVSPTLPQEPCIPRYASTNARYSFRPLHPNERFSSQYHSAEYNSRYKSA